MKPRDNTAHENLQPARAMPSKPSPQPEQWPDELAAQLREHAPPTRVKEGMAQRLRARALASAQAHKAFKVTRREDGHWQERGPGALARVLYQDTLFSVECVRLQGGAPLPWNATDHAQEILLLQGGLGWEGMPLQAMGYGVRSAAGTAVRAAPEGAELYVRHLRADPAVLAQAESRWWQQAAGLRVDDAMSGAWSDNGMGMQVRHLAQAGTVASMLIRLASGAVAPDHGHPIPEDCMMVEGELFLGDILLRAMDYQLAPVEAPHCSISSDTGALFFVHGALPA